MFLTVSFLCMYKRNQRQISDTINKQGEEKAKQNQKQNQRKEQGNTYKIVQN